VRVGVLGTGDQAGDGVARATTLDVDAEQGGELIG
jgi:hypothetical protein